MLSNINIFIFLKAENKEKIILKLLEIKVFYAKKILFILKNIEKELNIFSETIRQR